MALFDRAAQLNNEPSAAEVVAAQERLESGLLRLKIERQIDTLLKAADIKYHPELASEALQ